MGTNQYNWCSEDYPCTEDSKLTCPVQQWCVCQWAFATYVESVGCENVSIICDAVNRKALDAYAADLSTQKVQLTIVSLRNALMRLCSRLEFLFIELKGK